MAQHVILAWDAPSLRWWPRREWREALQALQHALGPPVPGLQEIDLPAGAFDRLPPVDRLLRRRR